MHFRHFLIPTLMVGAALLLPGNAFAEKNDNGSLHSNKEIVQTSEAAGSPAAQANNSNNAESAKPIEKAVTAPGQANRQKNTPVPSQAAPKQAASPQPANKNAKSLPEQANGNGYGLSNTKKADNNAVNPPGQEKKAEAIVTKVEQPVADDMDKTPPVHEVEGKVEPAKTVSRLQPQGEENIPNSNQAVRLDGQVPVPVEKEQAPSNKEEMPPVDQAPNPPQRSSNNSGSSNDRMSAGFGTISMVDKWFDWKKYFEMKLIQPFLTREALLNTQWVNAPPSPPPQAAPFLKTVNRC